MFQIIYNNNSILNLDSGFVGDKILLTKDLLLNDNITIRGTKLPSGYTELQYIQSSGTQYIDTGFKPNQNTRVIMTVTNSLAQAYWFGTWNTSYNNGAFALGNDGTSVYSGYDGQGGGSGSQLDSSIHLLDFNKNVVYIDDSVFRTFTATDFQVNYNLLLFGQNRSGSFFTLGSFALLGCKVYNDGVLIRDFIPAKQNSDSAIGMYDIVNNKWYGNAGSGTFEPGPEV